MLFTLKGTAKDVFHMIELMGKLDMTLGEIKMLQEKYEQRE